MRVEINIMNGMCIFSTLIKEFINLSSCFSPQWIKPQDIDFDPKYKKKGRSKTGKIEKRKQGVRFEHRREQIKELNEKKEEAAEGQKQGKKTKPYSVFDRFKKSE